jgi:hypothetical protein
MNDYDRANLEFLLNASHDVLKDWFGVISDDDKDYACELLQLYKDELSLKSILLDDFDNIDISAAGEYLKRFRS